MKRPETTLFMLMSVDGKISTGDVDERDVDKDFPEIPGVSDGLHQYYDLEKETDLFSLNSGRVFQKIGINEKDVFSSEAPVTLIVVDNKPHLTKQGVFHLIQNTKGLILISNNKQHPAIETAKENQKIRTLLYDDEIDFVDAFNKLSELGVDKLTIQSGGTLNATFLRLGLIDKLSIVVAPALIGGKDTSTLVDGVSLRSKEDLKNIKSLELSACTQLKNSYLHLEYNVVS